jgi:uncharacterized protein with HEPN domain
MPRDSSLYLEDILEAIGKIRRYISISSYEHFSRDELILDAVVRNLEVIGEAVKRIPEELRQKDSSIEWRKIAGLRDILAHEYFGIDAAILWDIVSNKLPPLESAVRELLKN